jgi:hypothetical protein
MICSDMLQRFDVHVRSDVLRRASLQKIKEALCDACMSA